MKIGLLGAGRMGSAIAVRLIESGHQVRVWNRTRAKAEALERSGAIAVRTPLEAAREADVLLSMLADDGAVKEAVLTGDAPAIEGLRAGRTHVSVSTISPRFAGELARVHHQRAQAYISAPVLGRPEAAARGDLVVLTAGPPAAIARSEALFRAMGKEVRPLGDDPRRANVVKLAVNFGLAAMLEALGEAYALVERYGVSDEEFLEVINGSMLRSPVVAAYGERIAKDAFMPAGFRLRLGLKDIHLALEAAEARALAMPIGSVVRDRFLEAMDLGMQDVDWSAVARAARSKRAA